MARSRRHDEIDGGADVSLETSGGGLTDDAAGGNGFAGLESDGADYQALGSAGRAGGFDQGLGILLSFADHLRNFKEWGTRGDDEVDGGAGGGQKAGGGS